MRKPSTPSKELQWPSNGSQTTSRHNSKSVSHGQPRSRQPATRGKSASGKTGRRGVHKNKRAVLLERLGLSPEQVDCQPQITPLLKQCGILPDRVMEVLQADTDPESGKAVQLWKSLTRAERSVLGLEPLALACGMQPRRLWELYCGATMVQARESLGVQIAEALPAIMRVTIKDAKKVKGYASREHVYKAARVLPTPKGSITNINVAQPQLESGEDDDDMEDGSVLGSADAFMLKASKAMSGTKALPAPTIEAEPVEEDEDEEEE